MPSFAQQNDGLLLARKVADKIIADTRFAFTLLPQKEVLGMQVLDFRSLQTLPEQQFYAKSQLAVLNDTTISFGLSYAGSISIQINRKQAYKDETGTVISLKRFLTTALPLTNAFPSALKKAAMR